MFLERIDRPDVDLVEHIRPAIALEQKNPVRTARSTVGTATELADYLRLLFAKIGRVHCPRCGRPAGSAAPDRVADALLAEAARRPGPGRLPAAGAARRPGRGPAGPAGRPRLRADQGGGRRGPAVPAPGPRPGRPRRRSTWCWTASCCARTTQTRLAGSLEQAFREGGGRAVVEIQRDGRPAEVRRYGEQFGCQTCGIAARAAPAPPLLLQPPARRLSRVQGVRQPPALRRGAGDPGPRHLARRRRRRALAAPVGRVVPEGAAPGRPAPQGRRPPALRGAARGRPALGVRRATRISAASAASSRRSRGTATSSTSGSSSPATGARFPARPAAAPA